MYSASRAPINPTPRPERQRERAKVYQLEAIAWMSVSGAPADKIATITGLSEAYINRLLSDKRNETFNKLRDEYKRKNLRNAGGRI